ncbi:MAG: MBL fold metallo-hydrolase [Clostridia bacterium]|nr:MBL fold metallo-hydrolase [Clostridia bacterium]
MKILQLPLEHPAFANRYLLIDEATNEAAAVDPAWYEGALKETLAAMPELRVKYILLTHGHFDHLLGAYALKAATGAAVVIHALDADCLSDPSRSLAAQNGLDQTPMTADLLVNDGDTLSLGSETIRVLHTPGHTPGGVCFLLERDRVIFSGDTLFCMTVGRTDLGGDPAAMADSLRRLIALEGDYRVLPGHNRETTLAQERRRNFFIRRMG